MLEMGLRRLALGKGDATIAQEYQQNRSPTTTDQLIQTLGIPTVSLYDSTVRTYFWHPFALANRQQIIHTLKQMISSAS